MLLSRRPADRLRLASRTSVGTCSGDWHQKGERVSRRRQFVAFVVGSGIGTLLACAAPTPNPAPTAGGAAPNAASPKAAAPTAAAAVPSSQAKAPGAGKVEPITVRLGWLDSGYHMPHFYAVDRWLLRERGLEPTTNQEQGSVPVMQLVADG